MKPNLGGTLFLFIVTALGATEGRNTDPRIVGGFLAKAEDVKHQVSLRFKATELTLGFGQGLYCGGSLITNIMILTAAHCVFDKENNPYMPYEIQIVMGNLDKTKHTPTTIVTDPMRFIAHPAYDPWTFENDIALIQLYVPITSHYPVISPIPLAEQPVEEGSQCLVSGWGNTIADPWAPADFPDLLLAANVILYSLELCNSSISYRGDLRDGMLCAGRFEGGVDSCQGDSGGPLVCDGKLVGAVSFGFGCGFENLPGIYSDVAFFHPWIEEEIKKAEEGEWETTVTVMTTTVELTTLSSTTLDTEMISSSSNAWTSEITTMESTTTMKDEGNYSDGGSDKFLTPICAIALAVALNFQLS